MEVGKIEFGPGLSNTAKPLDPNATYGTPIKKLGDIPKSLTEKNDLINRIRRAMLDYPANSEMGILLKAVLDYITLN